MLILMPTYEDKSTNVYDSHQFMIYVCSLRKTFGNRITECLLFRIRPVGLAISCARISSYISISIAIKINCVHTST